MCFSANPSIYTHIDLVTTTNQFYIAIIVLATEVIGYENSSIAVKLIIRLI